MYASYFGLRELPFNNTPDPRFFFATPDHEEALASLIYCVQERKGFVLLTGEVGTGKTLVSRLMLRQLGARIAFAHIHHAVTTPDALMEAACAEFELPDRPDMTPVQRTRMLHDFLLKQFAQNRPAVLILDEAQHLPLEAFEQLRMIGNLEADDAKLLQIVIVGQPELRTLFSGPELRQLRQRVFRVFHLSALNRESMESYVRHRLAVAGAEQGGIFSDDAFDAIFAHSHGFPRLINTLCDNALLSAYAGDQKNISAEFVSTVHHQTMMVDPAPATALPKPMEMQRQQPAVAPKETEALSPAPVPPPPVPTDHPIHSPSTTTQPNRPQRTRTVRAASILPYIERRTANQDASGSYLHVQPARTEELALAAGTDSPTDWTAHARHIQQRVEAACLRLQELVRWGDNLPIDATRPRRRRNGSSVDAVATVAAS